MAFFAFSEGPKGFSLANSRAFNGSTAVRAIFFSVQASAHAPAPGISPWNPGLVKFGATGPACTFSSRLPANGSAPANRAPPLSNLRRLIELPIRVYFSDCIHFQLPSDGYENRWPVTLECTAATTLRADSNAPAIQAFR